MDQRESLEDIYGDSGNALDAVFQQHDFGHHVHSYRPTNTLSADLSAHIGERLESDVNKKHKDAESIDQHKYARLANASYDHFNGLSQTSPHDSETSYEPCLKTGICFI